MTGCKVTRLQFNQFRRLAAAPLRGVGAAQVKVAPLGRIGRIGHIPLEDDAVSPRLRIGLRDGGKQRLGVGVGGPVV